jgi:phosphoglycolate phosphatase
MKTSAELLVFDLDGTLIDSKKDIAEAVNWALIQIGRRPLSEELIETYVGTGVQPLIQKTLADEGPDVVSQVIENFKSYYAAHLDVFTRPFPQIIDVLEFYSDTPKVILTNKTNEFVGPLLKSLNLSKYFKKFYGRNSFPTQKPDPGPLQSISNEFGVKPKKIIMIGDTDADILAGKGAGTRTCAVFFGYGRQEELVKLQPDLIASKPSELIGLL